MTIQTARNKCVLGAVAADRFFPTPLGEAVRDAWLALPGKYPELELGEFVMMPNHFHAIVRIRWHRDNKDQHLGFLVGRFKGSTTFLYGRMKAAGRAPDIGAHLWEYDYWDDLIVDARELAAFGAYIRRNPANWNRDRFGPCTGHLRGEAGLLAERRIAFVASQGFPASALHPRLWWRKGGTEVPRFDMDGAVLVSTFTSAQEREVLRRTLAKGERVVVVFPGGIPDDGGLPSGLAAACSEGRALLLSPVEPGTGVTKKAAAWCNEYVLAHAEEIWTGDLSEGGMLHALLRAFRC